MQAPDDVMVSFKLLQQKDAELRQLYQEKDAKLSEKDAELKQLYQEKDAKLSEKDAELKQLYQEKDAKLSRRPPTSSSRKRSRSRRPSAASRTPSTTSTGASWWSLARGAARSCALTTGSACRTRACPCTAGRS